MIVLKEWNRRSISVSASTREKFEENKEEKGKPHPLEPKPKLNFKPTKGKKQLKISCAKPNLRKSKQCLRKLPEGKSKLILSQTRHSHPWEYYSFSSSLQ